MSTKTSKSLSKRIRITKRGKIIRRPMAVDHFRTKKSSRIIQRTRKSRSLNYPKNQLLNY